MKTIAQIKKNQYTSVSTASGSTGVQINNSLEITPAPIGVPVNNPVPFAPKASGVIFWPVATRHPEGAFVSYRFGVNKDDVVSGRTRAREYGAFRPARGVATRAHDAIDLPALPEEEIVSCEKGTVLYRIERFLGNTSAIYIEHENLIGVYGEIYLNNLKRGDPIEAGQVIGKAGITPGGYTMLHFETKDKLLKTLERKNPTYWVQIFVHGN